MSGTHDFDRWQVRSHSRATLRSAPGCHRYRRIHWAMLKPLTPFITIESRSPTMAWKYGDTTPPVSIRRSPKRGRAQANASDKVVRRAITPLSSRHLSSPSFFPRPLWNRRVTAPQRKLRPPRRCRAMGPESSFGYSMPGVKLSAMTTGRGAT